MPAIYTADEDVLRATVTIADLEEVQPATVIPVIIADSDRAEWLSLYDETSATSPSAANSRIIARKVLDALQASE
jgi:hypothetical protein